MVDTQEVQPKAYAFPHKYLTGRTPGSKTPRPRGLAEGQGTLLLGPTARRNK